MENKLQTIKTELRVRIYEPAGYPLLNDPGKHRLIERLRQRCRSLLYGRSKRRVAARLLPIFTRAAAFKGWREPCDWRVKHGSMRARGAIPRAYSARSVMIVPTASIGR